MDPLTAASAAATLIVLVHRIVTSRFIYPAWEVLTIHHLRKNYGTLNQKFGTVQALVLMIILPNAKQTADRIEKHVLAAKTQDAIVLRKSTSEDCTMLAVAAAIVAQVAITALSLEDLDKVHWTANAAFVLSLTTGGLSVYYACLVQLRMSSLFTTDDVKDFFSKPSSSEELRHLEQRLDYLVSEMRERSPSDETTVWYERIIEMESIIKQFRSQNRWKSASFHSILMVKAPTILLKYAIASFIIGLGVYLGCLAFNKLDSQKPRESHRAIFIVYIVTSFVSLLIYFVPATLKDLELSPARRYVQIIANIPAENKHEEETKIIRNISTLLNSNELDTYEEHAHDDALSWEGRLDNMRRP